MKENEEEEEKEEEEEEEVEDKIGTRERCLSSLHVVTRPSLSRRFSRENVGPLGGRRPKGGKFTAGFAPESGSLQPSRAKYTCVYVAEEETRNGPGGSVYRHAGIPYGEN